MAATGKWDDNGDYLKPGIDQQGSHPVVCVSDVDAVDYAAWLSEKTGKHYRLPSEAEWEYAARAGKKTAWPWSNEVGSNGCKFVNTIDASGHKKYPINEAQKCDDKFVTTAPVGSFPANSFGLYDMLGNVWELVGDCWHDTYKGAPADGSSWGRRQLRTASHAWWRLDREPLGHAVLRTLGGRCRWPGDVGRLPLGTGSRLRSTSAFG